jgi:hypothetical protein
MAYLRRFLSSILSGCRGTKVLGVPDSINPEEEPEEIMPNFVSISSSYTASSNQLAFNKPAGVSEGDLLMAVIYVIDNDGTAYDMLGPDNWLSEDFGVFGTTNQYLRHRLFTYADASEPSTYTFTFDNGGTPRKMSGVLFSYRGGYRSAPGLPPPYTSWSRTEGGGDDFQAPDGVSSLALGPVWLDANEPQKVVSVYAAAHASSTPTMTVALDGGNPTVLLVKTQNPQISIAVVEEIVQPGAHIDPGDAGWDTAYEGDLTVTASTAQVTDWSGMTVVLSK